MSRTERSRLAKALAIGLAIAALAWRLAPSRATAVADDGAPDARIAGMANGGPARPKPPTTSPLAQAIPKGVAPAKADPAFASYQRLEELTLRTQAQRTEREARLSDRELIRRSTARLLQGAVASDVVADQSERLDRLNYLVQALRWDANPSRADVIEGASQVVLSARAAPGMSPAQRRAISGDRVELFMALAHYAPAEAAELRARADSARSEDPRSAKLIQFAENFYLSQKKQGVTR